MTITSSIRDFLQANVLPPLVRIPAARGALYNGLLLLRRGAVVQVGGRRVVRPILGERSLDQFDAAPSWKTWLIERLGARDGRTFVDVGVNTGETLWDVQLTHPELPYVGFEPNPACVAYLDELVAANGLRSCAIVPAALADREDVMRFYQSHDDAMDACGTLLGGLRPGRDLREIHVPAFRFDTIRESVVSGPIGFVKIDVEGAEPEVLRGMRATIESDRPVILCEVLWTNEKSDMNVRRQRNAGVMQMLEELDYHVLHVVKSPDMQRVDAVRRITEFPSAYWSVANKDECDYLFVPAEEAEQVAARAVAAHAGASEPAAAMASSAS